MVDWKRNVLARPGVEGRSHIPELPFWIFLIRIAQIVLAFIILILIAYAAHVFGTSRFTSYSFTFFTFSWTVLFFIFIIVFPLYFPEFYIDKVHLSFEALTTIFWLTNWSLLAKDAAAWKGFSTLESSLNTDLSLVGDTTNYFPHFDTAIACTKAGAGLGALLWALFVVTFIEFALAYKYSQAATAAEHVDVESAPTSTAPQEEKLPVSNQRPVELTDVGDSHHQVSSPAFA